MRSLQKTMPPFNSNQLHFVDVKIVLQGTMIRNWNLVANYAIYRLDALNQALMKIHYPKFLPWVLDYTQFPSSQRSSLIFNCTRPGILDWQDRGFPKMIEFVKKHFFKVLWRYNERYNFLLREAFCKELNLAYILLWGSFFICISSMAPCQTNTCESWKLLAKNQWWFMGNI